MATASTIGSAAVSWRVHTKRGSVGQCMRVHSRTAAQGYLLVTRPSRALSKLLSVPIKRVACQRSVIMSASGEVTGGQVGSGYAVLKLGLIGAVIVAATSPWLPIGWSAGFGALEMHQTLAASLVPVVAAVQCLEAAAQHDRLASGTYQKLNAGLLLLLGITAVASWPVVSAQGLAIRLAWGIVWGLALTLCMRVQGGPGSIQHSFQSAASSISSAAASSTDIKGTTSAAYAAGAVGATCAAVADWTQLPQHVLVVGSASTWLSRMLSATTVFAVVVLLVLKDASERGRLGASTFKSLNGSMAASSTCLLLVIYRWYTRASIPSALVLHAAVATYLTVLTGYYRVTAKK